MGCFWPENGGPFSDKLPPNAAVGGRGGLGWAGRAARNPETQTKERLKLEHSSLLHRKVAPSNGRS